MSICLCIPKYMGTPVAYIDACKDTREALRRLMCASVQQRLQSVVQVLL